ncbi:MAG: hypothetical protein HY553_06765 [Elusimicrobia bacterium]|nr:hypothetical protein [Elusimicrobiota bacterium]
MEIPPVRREPEKVRWRDDPQVFYAAAVLVILVAVVWWALPPREPATEGLGAAFPKAPLSPPDARRRTRRSAPEPELGFGEPGAPGLPPGALGWKPAGGAERPGGETQTPGEPEPSAPEPAADPRFVPEGRLGGVKGLSEGSRSSWGGVPGGADGGGPERAGAAPGRPVADADRGAGRAAGPSYGRRTGGRAPRLGAPQGVRPVGGAGPQRSAGPVSGGGPIAAEPGAAWPGTFARGQTQEAAASGEAGEARAARAAGGGGGAARAGGGGGPPGAAAHQVAATLATVSGAGSSRGLDLSTLYKELVALGVSGDRLKALENAIVDADGDVWAACAQVGLAAECRRVCSAQAGCTAPGGPGDAGGTPTTNPAVPTTTRPGSTVTTTVADPCAAHATEDGEERRSGNCVWRERYWCCSRNCPPARGNNCSYDGCLTTVNGQANSCQTNLCNGGSDCRY